VNCVEVSKFQDEHSHFCYSFIVSQTQIASGIVTCLTGVPTELVLLSGRVGAEGKQKLGSEITGTNA
jgi:hypothetical protein